MLFIIVIIIIIIIIVITEIVRRPLQGISGAVQYNVKNYTKKLRVKC